MFRILNSFPVVVGVYISIPWSPITSRNYFAFQDIQEVVNGSYSKCNPITGSLVILDLIPVVVFEVKFDGKVCAFEKDKVSNVVSNFQPHHILQISSGNIPVPSSSNWHSGLEVFLQCHNGKFNL